MAKTVRADKMAAEINKILREYETASEEAVDSAVRLTASDTVKNIRNGAREQFGGTGEYASSWAQKAEKRRNAYTRIVYARAPYYRLTHLLENGHAKINGGRVEGRPHIAPAATAVGAKLTRYIKLMMEGIK